MPRSPEQSHIPDTAGQEQGTLLEQQGRSLTEEVMELRSKAKTKEDFELLVTKMKQLERLYDVNSLEFDKGETTYEKAKEIMGNDFFGLEEVEKAFGTGYAISKSDPREVPYSSEELELAKRNGEMLVLRAPLTRFNSDDLTMKQINEVIQPKMTSGDGKLLFDTDWYQDEEFFKNQLVREGWALVSKELIADSTSKDYINQTKVLRDHLKSLDSLTEDELKEVTDEKLDKIREIMSSDWKEAAKQLAELKINQNHRRTAAEALYDFVIRFKNTDDKERMLETKYDWTNTRSSDGYLVYFGCAGTQGAFVHRDEPWHSSVFLGVVSVR